MRRRSVYVLASWALAAAWIGCNAILGNESAVFDPGAASSSGDVSDGSRDDADEGSANDGALDSAAEDSGPCVDLASNPEHCGACFHDCLGGDCFGGVCQPVTLATDDGNLFAIAIDGEHVYWGNRTTGDIMRVRVADGTMERVYDGPSGTDPGAEFAVHDGHVYFPNLDPDGGPAALVRCPVSGCPDAAEVVIAGLVAPNSVSVLDGGTLLFVELQGGRIGRCSLPCDGGFETVASGEELPQRATAAHGIVAWSNLDIAAGGTVRAKLGDAAPITAAKASLASAVAIVGDEILFADLSHGVKAVGLDGGAVRRLTTFAAQSSYLAVDDENVYFTHTFPTSGAVYRCAFGGCDDSAPVAANQDNPHGVAVDERSVYWVTGDGRVRRVAK